MSLRLLQDNSWERARYVYLSKFMVLWCFYVYVCMITSSETKGPGEEGAPRNHPEISSQKVADFVRKFSYDSYGKNRAPFWPFWEKDFGAISSGPFFSRRLWFTAEKGALPYTLWIGEMLTEGISLHFWRGNPLKLRTSKVPTPSSSESS